MLARANSKRHRHNCPSGRVIQFEDGYYETNNTEEIQELRRFNGVYWVIVSDSHNKFDNGLNRKQLMLRAEEMGFSNRVGKNVGKASNSELMEFIRG